MKKVSTVAAKQIRNISPAKLTIGLDLGDRASWYCGWMKQARLCWSRNWARPRNQ